MTAQTPSRTEEYCVLIAPSGDLWRARIVTFPSMLWSVPQGRQTMKFVARSAEAVEKLARDYIRQFCIERKFKMSAIRTDAPAGPVNSDTAPGADDAGQPRRLLHAVTIRFGEEKLDRSGCTLDLSAGGLAVETRQPLPMGRRVKLVMEVEGSSLPLVGTVVWARSKAEGDRPAGMGVQLQSPPALYRHYVRKLTGGRRA